MRAAMSMAIIGVIVPSAPVDDGQRIDTRGDVERRQGRADLTAADPDGQDTLLALGIPKLSQYDPAVTMKRNRNCEPAASPDRAEHAFAVHAEDQDQHASVSILVALLTNGWIEEARTPTGV